MNKVASLTKRYLPLAAIALGLLLVTAGSAQAATSIERNPNMVVSNDYVVGPGKVELLASPGQTIIKNITVVNRFATPKTFQLDLEDFKGSRENGVNLELLGALRGPYSLKDYLNPEASTFTLQPGDRITIPVRVTIPKDAVPGGLYGSIIVTTKEDPSNPSVNAEDATGNVKVISRIAVLFFVRIKGDVKESGSLLGFSADKFYYDATPVNFGFSYENTGSVYANPYGNITIKNLYGSVVDSVEVLPFYVLPNALRTNQVKWTGNGYRLGYYTATLKLNYGFNNQFSEKTVGFLVISWKLVIGVLIALALLVLIIRFIIKWLKDNVQLKPKKRR